ncbi:hypothetical protein [Gracilibacillus dipsosauri]
MEVINKDKNGNIITDLSKKEIPNELQKKLFYMINPYFKNVN